MKTILSILSIILLLSLVLNGWLIWDKKQAQKERFADNSKLNEVITSKTAQVLTLDRRILKADSLRLSDSIKFKSRLIASNDEIQAYKSQVAKLRPQVQAKIDSFPDLREFVELQDSIIVKQDSLIRAQDLFCATQIRDFNEILALHQQKFTAQQQISEAWMETAAEARKDAVKEKRKKNFFKITSGILTAGIIFMAVRE